MENIQQFKIFIVDDDPFCLNLYEQHLINLGCNDVTTYNNGVECLNAIVEKPEVIFLDHNMDVLNGFELLKKIKRFDPEIFVIMISGQEDMKTAIDALKYGAFDYIIKNNEEVEKLEEVLRRITGIRHEMAKSRHPFLKKILAIL